MDSITVLITGAGAPGAAGIIHCLKQDPKLRIVSVDANPLASGQLLSHAFHVVPPASDASFIPSVLEIAIKEKVQVIMPLVTRELNLFALAKGQFLQAGITVLVSSIESLDISNDKGQLYQYLQSKEIRTPAFRLVNTVKGFQDALSSLGFPERQVCFKPVRSNGSRGFRILETEDRALHRLFNEKPNQTYIQKEEILAILDSGPWPELMVCEYLPGEEYSVDCLVLPNQNPLIIPRRRDRMLQGISTAGTFIEDNDILIYCEQILKTCNLTGNIGIQVKRDITGEALILEINPRVQGSISAALGAGVNLPLLHVQHALGIPVDLGSIQPKWGTRFVRVWKELFYDL